MIVRDVTQAFVHADMDELIITRVPRELDGMKITNGDDEETILYEGMWLAVLKALYEIEDHRSYGNRIS